MNEGVDQPLLVGFVLFIRRAPELLQHEEQLIAGVERCGRRFLNGFNAIAQSGFLLLQFTQSGGKTRAAGPVLNGTQDVVLLLGAFQQLGFQHFFLRVFDVLFGLLHLHNTVGNLLQFPRGEDVLGGGGNNQVLQKRFFDIPLGATVRGVVGTGIIVVFVPVFACAADALHCAAAHLAIQFAG